MCVVYDALLHAAPSCNVASALFSSITSHLRRTGAVSASGAGVGAGAGAVSASGTGVGAGAGAGAGAGTGAAGAGAAGAAGAGAGAGADAGVCVKVTYTETVMEFDESGSAPTLNASEFVCSQDIVIEHNGLSEDANKTSAILAPDTPPNEREVDAFHTIIPTQDLLDDSASDGDGGEPMDSQATTPRALEAEPSPGSSL